jgi:hypothetical protein
MEQNQEYFFKTMARHLTGIRNILRETIIQIPLYTAFINFSLLTYGSYLQSFYTSVLSTKNTPITLSLFFKISFFFSHISPPFN